MILGMLASLATQSFGRWHQDMHKGVGLWQSWSCGQHKHSKCVVDMPARVLILRAT